MIYPNNKFTLFYLAYLYHRIYTPLSQVINRANKFFKVNANTSITRSIMLNGYILSRFPLDLPTQESLQLP